MALVRCRCKNCSNSVIVVTSAPGTQLEQLVEIKGRNCCMTVMLRDAHGEEHGMSLLRNMG